MFNVNVLVYGFFAFIFGLFCWSFLSYLRDETDLDSRSYYGEETHEMGEWPLFLEINDTGDFQLIKALLKNDNVKFSAQEEQTPRLYGVNEIWGTQRIFVHPDELQEARKLIKQSPFAEYLEE